MQAQHKEMVRVNRRDLWYLEVQFGSRSERAQDLLRKAIAYRLALLKLYRERSFSHFILGLPHRRQRIAEGMLAEAYDLYLREHCRLHTEAIGLDDEDEED